MPPTPRPGRSVRGSRTGRPIMALIDLLGRRWALRVIWELREAPLPFRALQDACGGVSPTVLNERLKELRESRLVDLMRRDGYELTPLGRQLQQLLVPLSVWSGRWGRDLHRRRTPRNRSHGVQPTSATSRAKKLSSVRRCTRANDQIHDAAKNKGE
jgi:DNA-binding HxlR family transcriptional regulator